MNRLADFWARQAERVASALDLDQDLPDVFEAFDTDAEIRALSPVIQAHMLRIAEASAWDVLSVWNPESDGWSPDLMDNWIAKASETNATAWCRSVETHLAERAATVDGPKALGEYLEGKGPGWMASRFASEAQSFGAHDAATKTGLNTKTWRVTSGKKARKSHQKINGHTIGMGDVFPNGLRWPGDRNGEAGETAECSCILEYGRES